MRASHRVRFTRLYAPQYRAFLLLPPCLAIVPGTRGASTGPSAAGGEGDISPETPSQCKAHVKSTLAPAAVGMSKAKARAIQWDMKGFLQQCIAVYIELAGSHAPKLRKVVSPFIEQKAESPEDMGKAGALAPVASKILMKILYAARMARPDLLRATCYLATRITKWTPQCDRMLYRLVCYIHSSLDYFLHGWVGDDPQKLELCLYTDADFAGDPDNARSTSGVYLCLRGPNSFVPLWCV